MNIAETIVTSSRSFYHALKEDKNGRYLSWEHCYREFYHARFQPLSEKEYDFLALHLSFYLASWGMYRGSSFLLWKDYKVHIPAVKEILFPHYDGLLGIPCSEYANLENQKSLEMLNDFLRSYYNSVRLSIKENKPQNKISDTLITKILMGTLGCVPAYDRYFNYGIKKYKIASASYNLKSILSLCRFYQDNSVIFDEACSDMKIGEIPYPQMKFLDMGFWEIGFRDDGN